MAVKCFGYRTRGDWSGIASCIFLACCWAFASYCSVFTIINRFFAAYDDARHALLGGHVAISLLTIVTMAKCVMSNPGQLLDVSNAELLGWKFCESCQKHRPPRSHHCSRCAQCVRKMDHHCPWINNCVGEDNNMKFTLFLMYAALMAWCSLLLCFSYFLNWLPECRSCDEDVLDIKIEVICLAIISIAYGFFTSFMFVDRMIMITADVTTLELMADQAALRKGFHNPRKLPWFKQFSRTFGTSNVLCWFVPCRTVHIRPSYECDTYSWQDLI